MEEKENILLNKKTKRSDTQPKTNLTKEDTNITRIELLFRKAKSLYESKVYIIYLIP